VKLIERLPGQPFVVYATCFCGEPILVPDRSLCADCTLAHYLAGRR